MSLQMKANRVTVTDTKLPYKINKALYNAKCLRGAWRNKSVFL